MDIFSRSRSKEESRRLPRVLLWSLRALAVTAVGLALQNPVSFAIQNAVPTDHLTIETKRPIQAGTSDYLVRVAKPPIVVEIDLGGTMGAPAVPDDAADRVVAAIDANPRRLVTLRIKGGTLHFNGLNQSTRLKLLAKRGAEIIDAYNSYMARQIRDLLNAVDAVRSHAPVSIQGLPFEGDESEVASANRAFEPVINRLDAVVLAGAMMISGTIDELSILRRSNPRALAASNNRAIIFASNGGWRIATVALEENSSPSSESNLELANVLDPDRVIVESGQTMAGQVNPLADFLGSPDPSSDPISPEPSGANADNLARLGEVQGTGESPLRGGGRGFAGGQRGQVGAGSNGVADVNQQDGTESGDGGSGSMPWNPPDEFLDESSLPAESEAADEQSDSTSTENEQDGSSNESDEGLDSGSDSNETSDSSTSGSQIGWTETLLAEGPPCDDLNVPELSPGMGFSGAESPREPEGNPNDLGYASSAIGRWNVVPFQKVNDIMRIGVVAYHLRGINRVEFSLNGGDWTSVHERCVNERTGAEEFAIDFNPATISDGLVEIRGIVYPNTGLPLILAGDPDVEGRDEAGQDVGTHSLFLASNWGGLFDGVSYYVGESGDDINGEGTRERPFRSIVRAAREIRVITDDNADGCSIRLLPGRYQYQHDHWQKPTTTSCWLTIEAAEGVDRNEVELYGGLPTDQFQTRLVRLHRLTVRANTVEEMRLLVGNPSQDRKFFVDQCSFIGPGRLEGGSFQGGGTRHEYYVNIEYRDATAGLGNATILREASFVNQADDVLSGAKLAVAVNIRGLDGAGTQFHTDVIQFYSNTGLPIRNRLYVRISSLNGPGSGQAYFAGRDIALDGIALVDSELSNIDPDGAGDGARCFQFAGPVANFLVRNCVIAGPANWRSDLGFEAVRDVVIQACFNDLERTARFVPFPDRVTAPPNGDWTSPLDVRYEGN